VTFTEQCCGRARGYLPQQGADPVLISERVLAAGVLICSRCDYDHDRATVIPRENAMRDLRPRA
jgi:hypothetical protein